MTVLATIPEGSVLTMPNTNAIDISSLYYSAVGAQSVHFNFGAGYGETWEDVPLPYLTCSSCDFVGQDESYEEGEACPHCILGEGQSCLELPECRPMMNYYYPLPNYDRNPEADQLHLYKSSANVVLVQIRGGEDVEDSYALALSGGGMDLSFDICHAYILLGYAPPLVFCDLPHFAGQDNRKEPFASIIKACFQSTKSALNRLERQVDRLLVAQSWTGKA